MVAQGVELYKVNAGGYGTVKACELAHEAMVKAINAFEESLKGRSMTEDERLAYNLLVGFNTQCFVNAEMAKKGKIKPAQVDPDARYYL